MDWVLIGVGFAGWAVAAYWWDEVRELRGHFADQRDCIEHWRNEHLSAVGECGETYRTLNTLRANCFIPNEKGHKVRYWDASEQRRAKAEGRD